MMTWYASGIEVDGGLWLAASTARAWSRAALLVRLLSPSPPPSLSTTPSGSMTVLSPQRWHLPLRRLSQSGASTSTRSATP